MLKAAFKTQLFHADPHTHTCLVIPAPRWSDGETGHSLSKHSLHSEQIEIICLLNRTAETDLSRSDDKLWEGSMVYQVQRTNRLSTQKWKYPPDVINQCIINPILSPGATDWLHASVTLSNPGVSIRKNPLEISFWAWCQMLAMKYS